MTIKNRLAERRAARLRDPVARQDLAAALEQALDCVPEIHRLWHDQDACRCRDELALARPALDAVLDRLRAPGPVGAAGVLEVRAALAHGGPRFYRPGEPGSLRSWARDVQRDLEP
jgi:hypothetical protein